MAVETVSIARVLYEYVTTTGTDLYSLIADRFHIEQLPEDWTPATAAIVYGLESGSWTDSTPINTFTFFVRCYGGADSGKSPTMLKALDLYGELHDRLHEVNMQDVTSGTLMLCREIASAQTAIDPDLDVPYVVARYEAQVRNTT